MNLLKKVRKIVLPLAFVGVGVFGYFQANAAAAPDLDCIEVAVYHTELLGVDISQGPGFAVWQASYIGCILSTIMN